MSKLPNTSTSIFTIMSKLAIDNKAINLSQGFPDFPVDPILLDILQKTATEEVHQYMPMGGSPSLLSAISALIEKNYDRRINPSEDLLITAGATQAIFTIIQSLIYQDDEVIILDPSYDCYEPSIILAGGKAVRVQMRDDFSPDWDKIDALLTPKTKMIITNNPHNPSGKVWKLSDVERLEKIASKHKDILFLSDEVYEYIHFENPHISLNTRKALIDRAIIVSSFGKTFHITGWKIGYVVAPVTLMDEIKKVHQFNVFSVNSVSQACLTEYIKARDVTQLGTFYQVKRDLFRQLLSHSSFDLLPCEGTYFQAADYSKISDESDVDFCKTLTTKHGVAAIPMSVFSKKPTNQKIIRFCFAKNESTLISATKKLCKI